MGPNINYDKRKPDKQKDIFLKEDERVRSVFLTFYVSVHPQLKNQKCCLNEQRQRNPCRQNTYKDTHTNT